MAREVVEKIRKAVERGAEYHRLRLIVASVMATPIGVDNVLSKYPHAEIYTVAIDPALNDRAFIAPGLGEFCVCEQKLKINTVAVVAAMQGF